MERAGPIGCRRAVPVGVVPDSIGFVAFEGESRLRSALGEGPWILRRHPESRHALEAEWWGQRSPRDGIPDRPTRPLRLS